MALFVGRRAKGQMDKRSKGKHNFTTYGLKRVLHLRDVYILSLIGTGEVRGSLPVQGGGQPSGKQTCSDWIGLD